MIVAEEDLIIELFKKEDQRVQGFCHKFLYGYFYQKNAKIYNISISLRIQIVNEVSS